MVSLCCIFLLAHWPFVFVLFRHISRSLDCTSMDAASGLFCCSLLCISCSIELLGSRSGLGLVSFVISKVWMCMDPKAWLACIGLLMFVG